MQEIAILASRALTSQHRFTAVADNVANVNSYGYRRLEMDFKEVVSRPGGHATASYVDDRSISISNENGSFEQTGNPFDAAIGGEGYFAVQAGQNILYTRRGQFLVNAEGTLVTPEGNPVLDNANAPIQLPAGITTVNIASDGTLSTDQGQLAQIGVFNFTAEQQRTLQRAGDTSFSNISAPAPVENPVIRQGFLEGSNVNAVKEMVTMQMVARAYQSAMSQLNDLNELETRAIRTLGGNQ